MINHWKDANGIETKGIPQTGKTYGPLEDSGPQRNNIPSRIQSSELKETGTEICTYLGCLNLDLWYGTWQICIRIQGTFLSGMESI